MLKLTYDYTLLTLEKRQVKLYNLNTVNNKEWSGF